MYVNAAYLSQALALASTTKVHVAAYYDEHGEWPSSNEQAGLPAAADYANESVSGLAISEGGVIRVRFNEKSAVGDGFLRKEIAAFVPQCKPED